MSQPLFKLDSLEAVYVQEQDTEDPGHDVQELRIRTAGGPEPNTYFVLETKRWAVESPQELAAVLQDFVTRLTLLPCATPTEATGSPLPS